MRLLTICWVLGTLGVVGAAEIGAEEIIPEKKANFEKLEKPTGGEIFKKFFKKENKKEGTAAAAAAAEGVEREGRQVSQIGGGFPLYFGFNGYYPGGNGATNNIGFGFPFYYGFNGYYPSTTAVTMPGTVVGTVGGSTSTAGKRGSSYPWWLVDNTYNYRPKSTGCSSTGSGNMLWWYVDAYKGALSTSALNAGGSGEVTTDIDEANNAGGSGEAPADIGGEGNLIGIGESEASIPGLNVDNDDMMGEGGESTSGTKRGTMGNMPWWYVGNTYNFKPKSTGTGGGNKKYPGGHVYNPYGCSGGYRDA